MGEEEAEISMKHKVLSIKVMIMTGVMVATGIFLFGAENRTSAAGSIAINEIFFNPSGSDTGKEFVELYNSDSISHDLKNLSLKLSDNTSLAKFGSTASDQTVIPANGYLLVVLNG